ncbi:hypothetical protein MCHI_000623 [Candidatus Magnetoovum chiemensis]|nr:hypothetical protein MCHI_000623 [Candidatus Magnetoovum chiemensis]
MRENTKGRVQPAEELRNIFQKALAYLIREKQNILGYFKKWA